MTPQYFYMLCHFVDIIAGKIFHLLFTYLQKYVIITVKSYETEVN